MELARPARHLRIDLPRGQHSRDHRPRRSAASSTRYAPRRTGVRSRRLRYERLEADGLVGWADEESRSAREYGDAWLGEARTAVLFVPSATARPFGHTVLLNPRHPDYRGSGSSSRGRSPGTRGSSGSDPADRHRPFLRSMALWRSHPASHRVVGRAEQHHAESRSVDSGNRKKNTSSSLPGTRRRVYPEVIHGSRPTPPSVSPLDRRDPE